LSKVAPEIAADVPDLRRVVAFRDISVHGCATVDDALVWQLLGEELPVSEKVLRNLLERG
jgi:uncharacterized protein with HEPN domain